MTIDLLPAPPESFVKNCLVIPKHDDKQSMFAYRDGLFVARLDGYAIVPKKDYEEMVEILDELRKFCPDLSGG